MHFGRRRDTSGFTKQALGRHLYLYKQPVRTQSLVISSHGGYRPSTGTLDLREIMPAKGEQGSLEGCSVYFFKRHGFVSGFKILSGLGSTDYENFEKYTISDAEGEKGQSVIINYEVSKYPEDSTEVIVSAMQLINADKTVGVPVRDVVTIRNRVGPNQKIVTLEKVIRKAVPLGYRRFYCLFCRSQMEGDAIKLQGFKPLNDLLPMDHPDQKMVSDNDYRTWERTRDLSKHWG